MTEIRNQTLRPLSVEYYTLGGQKTTDIERAKPNLQIERVIREDGAITTNKIYTK